MHDLMRLQARVRHVFLLALRAHGYVAVETLAHSPLLPFTHPFIHIYRWLSIVTQFTKSVGYCYILSG